MHPRYLHEPVESWAELPPIAPEVADLLEAKASQYNTVAFIESDPVAIPHRFHKREDIEIAGLLTANIAWGRRASVLQSAERLMGLLDWEPHAFITTASEAELKPLGQFVHRTFQGEDALHVARVLRQLYRTEGGLEAVLTGPVQLADADLHRGLLNYRARFVGAVDLPRRMRKHVPDIATGSAAKRLNMFLRWMVRRDGRGVDFGLWRGVRPDQLIVPLDVHTGRVARALGLIHRRADDWRAARELTAQLRRLDPADPVRFDYALFGLGVFEGFPEAAG